MKRKNKSKQDIRHEMKLIEDAKKGKKIVREVLYPIFVKYADTIRQAELFADIFKVAITVNMQRPFKSKTIGELDWSEELKEEKEGKSHDLLVELLDKFKDVPIPDAIKTLEGFQGGIQAYFEDEKKKRPFKDIKLEELIYKD